MRILHVIDWLGGGGSEQMIWEIVSRSPSEVTHRVAPVHPYNQDFFFAARFQSMGAYDIPAQSTATSPAVGVGGGEQAPAPLQDSAAAASGASEPALARLRRLLAPALRGLPTQLKRPVWEAEEVLSSLPRLLAEARRHPPSVIHAHGLSGFRYGLWLSQLTGVPLVHTVTCHFDQLRAIGWERLISLYQRSLGAVSRWFIAEPYVPDLLGLGIPAARIGPLTGVVDLAAIDKVRAEAPRHRREIRRALGLPEDALLALSVGRWDPIKGHQHAVDALPRVVHQLPELHWMALGSGRQPPDYAARAANLGAPGHAHVVGYRPDPLPYYAAADLYLRTTTIEADNLSSYNAMAMGLPVVGFDSGCPTELLPSVGHGTLVHNEDPVALADGILRLLALPDRGRSLGERGRQYATDHLDLGASIDEFLASYRQVTARNPGPIGLWGRIRGAMQGGGASVV